MLEIEAETEPLARLFSAGTRKRPEVEILPEWLKGRRWYAAKDADQPQVPILDVTAIGADGRTARAVLAATPPGQPAQTYSLLLAPCHPPWSEESLPTIGRCRS